MKRTRWAGPLVVIVALAAGAISCTKTTTSTTTPGTPAEDAVARGHRIVYTSACMDCHTPGAFYGTPDTTRMLSGSELGWTGPWGTSYARNLTPDSTTGIGKWTAQDIVTALREGHRPDGTPLLPPMPWPVYSRMTDEDANAVAAYLKSIPPVVHEVPKVVPPGQDPGGSHIIIPPPSAWDARNLPPPPGAPPAAAGAAKGH